MNRNEDNGRPGGRRRDLAAALKSDAGRIRAEYSRGFERRLAAALARVEPGGTPPPRETFVRPWLAGSLAGVAAAALVMLLFMRVEEGPAPAATPDVALAQPMPEYLQMFRDQVPLHAETAELTAPLEEELRDLKSDFEKARENLERDLKLAF